MSAVWGVAVVLEKFFGNMHIVHLQNIEKNGRIVICNGGKEIFFLCLLHYNDTCKVNQQFTGGERKVVKLNIQTAELALREASESNPGAWADHSRFVHENFLDTVNACIGKVYTLCPNGKQQNINGEEKIQDSLWRQYFQNKNCLCLILEIPNPTDYMNIVSYYAGDC